MRVLAAEMLITLANLAVDVVFLEKDLPLLWRIMFSLCCVTFLLDSELRTFGSGCSLISDMPLMCILRSSRSQAVHFLMELRS